MQSWPWSTAAPLGYEWSHPPAQSWAIKIIQHWLLLKGNNGRSHGKKNMQNQWLGVPQALMKRTFYNLVNWNVIIDECHEACTKMTGCSLMRWWWDDGASLFQPSRSSTWFFFKPGNRHFQLKNHKCCPRVKLLSEGGLISLLTKMVGVAGDLNASTTCLNPQGLASQVSGCSWTGQHSAPVGTHRCMVGPMAAQWSDRPNEPAAGQT